MEKLSLEKFSDSKLKSETMSFINAGAGGGCTGGGFQNYPEAGIGRSWTSDSIDECGNTTLYGIRVYFLPQY